MAARGNCYICGKELSKAGVKKHLAVHQHNGSEAGEECVLLKIEGAYYKDYWLFLDIPSTATLDSLDRFLREIWLECCGHMSAFFGKGHQEIKNSRKFSTFEPGEQFLHEYDFGDTTETLITVVGRTRREPQKAAVRLLVRNIPPLIPCSRCGAPAAYVSTDNNIYKHKEPFLCKACACESEIEEFSLPVTNSPRIGICGYCGDLDVYAFDAEKFAHREK